LISEKNRRVFVAENPIDLSDAEGRNCIYVLELPSTSPGSAGGRVGGVGERKVVRALCFCQVEGAWTKRAESEDPEKLNLLDLPYHAAGLPVMLPDKTERIVSGVVDEELARTYSAIL